MPHPSSRIEDAQLLFWNISLKIGSVRKFQMKIPTEQELHHLGTALKK